jgi:peroxiredoxin
LPANLFSGIQLPTPKTAEARDYLGIGDADPFSLGDIDTQILIIEVFSMYCPHCQREAPNVNRLFDQIVDRSDLKEKIKMIGIGVGNNDYEIDIFRKTYDIAFPLFADPSMEISKTLKAERTPTFIAIAYDEAPMLKQVYFQVGNMADGDLFLKEIIERSGLPIASGQ